MSCLGLGMGEDVGAFGVRRWRIALLAVVWSLWLERSNWAFRNLVDIWEERRVFGSRARGLKNIMLANEPPPPLELNKKRSRAIRILRRDSRSIKIKLAIGGIAEKIVSSFHSVLSEYPNEETDLNKCKAVVRRVGKMEKDVDNACLRKGDPRRTTLAEELQEEENLLKQCIERLESIQESRVALVSQLKEALQEQESELENVRTQLQVAQAQVEEASNMRRRLNGDTSVTRANPSSSSATPPVDQGASAGETSKKTAAAIAAEVADKLAASTSSQQIMTSVLSTFAAQAAKNVGLMASTNPSNTVIEFPSEKRQKLENSMPVPDSSTFITAQQLSLPVTHQHPTVFVHQPSIQAQASTSQPQYTLLPTPSSHQYMQPSGGMMIGMPYGYSTLPPPPPSLPPAHVMNLARPALLTQQPMALQQSTPLTLQQSTPLTLQQQAMSLIQQQPAPPSFRPLQPPTMAFYSHPHQPQ